LCVSTISITLTDICINTIHLYNTSVILFSQCMYVYTYVLCIQYNNLILNFYSVFRKCDSWLENKCKLKVLLNKMEKSINTLIFLAYLFLNNIWYCTLYYINIPLLFNWEMMILYTVIYKIYILTQIKYLKFISIAYITSIDYDKVAMNIAHKRRILYILANTRTFSPRP